MHQTPNIFHHATSELSQDAFLAWLCEWADDKYVSHPSGMHHAGRAFISWLFGKKGLPTPAYTKVDVQLQYLHIDVLVKLTLSDGGIRYLLIEDKTYTSDHSEQINGYLQALREKDAIEDPSHVLPVYFKSSLEPRKNDGILRLYLTDIMECVGVLDKMTYQSEVLRSWCDARMEEHTTHEKYRSLPVTSWENAQWYGCFDQMSRRDEMIEMEAGYGYVPLGDFLGFWLGWEGKPKDWCTYIQVDVINDRDPSITFRIASPEGLKVDKARMQAAFKAVEKTAINLGKRLNYPKWARGGGKSSRFAVLDEPFMSSNRDGRFDEELFAKQLVACRTILVESEAHMEIGV